MPVRINPEILTQSARSISKQYLRGSVLIQNLLLPAALLALYCGSFAYLSANFLIKGVNFVFTSRAWQYALAFEVCVALFSLALFKLRKVDKFNISPEKVSASHLILLFLPLTPVAQYAINNRDILSPFDTLLVFIFFTVFSAIFIVAIPALLGKFSSPRALVSVGLAFAFTMISMVSLSHEFSWFEKGNFKIQVLFFSSVCIAAWFLLNPKYKRDFLILVVVYFAASSGFQWLAQEKKLDEPALPVGGNKLQAIMAGRKPAATPNIYLLIYDSYVPNETMLAYGIDNRPQEDYLRDQGFVLYPHTYSIGSNTVSTMSRVLNASAEYNGPPRRGVSGDGIVHNTLQSLGYETYGLFPYDFMFRGTGSSYDFSIPESSAQLRPYALLISAILTGEFRFDFGFDALSRAQFIETKHSIFTGNSEKRIFVYSHSDFPGHSQDSGVCRPNEMELFRERLEYANLEMRQDIQTIIQNDPEAILIVAGDHGPYLTRNCIRISKNDDRSEISRTDIQDRFGTFLAIRWPNEDYASYDDISVLQDLFPAIFAYLYQDSAFLALKVRPNLVDTEFISKVSVRNGIIDGGIHDGEPLFLSGE